MKNKQNILLTGSEGLIGSNFIKNCHSEYKNIFALDIKKKLRKIILDATLQVKWK